MAQKGKKIGNMNGVPSCIDTNAITRIAIKTHRIIWTIQNFSKIVNDTKLVGPDFSLSPTKLASIAFKRNDSNFYVYVCNKSDAEILIQREILLLDCNNKKLHEDKDSKMFTLKKYADIDVINVVEDRGRFYGLPNDTLIIDLSISMTNEITTEMCHFQSIEDPKKKLIEDLKMMQKNAVNSDVLLQVGDERIPAHWSILCSRSPYFKKMFDCEMIERVQNSITITDLSLCNLKRLVEFLYTANLVEDDNEDLEELFNLYYAADKYEVTDLHILCGQKIMSKATADNVCQIFQLAHRHNDKSLKIQAMDFLKFHSDEIFQTDGWKKFEASEPLAAEIFSFCLKKN